MADPVPLRPEYGQVSMPARGGGLSNSEKSPAVDFGGGGGGSGVDSDVQAYIDAKADAVRAQNDARFAEVLTAMSGLKDRMGHIPTTWETLAMMAGVGVTVFGLIVAVLAFGGDRFDGGMQAASVSVQQATEARQQAIAARRVSEDNAAAVKSLNQKMDVLLQAVGAKVKQDN